MDIERLISSMTKRDLDEACDTRRGPHEPIHTVLPVPTSWQNLGES